jgi:transcriptional regulator with XRE-family HTH domain
MAKRILNKIQQIQWDKNLTDQDIADKARLNKSTVNRIKNGLREPSQKTLIQIAYALNIPTHEVFELDWRKLDLEDFM